MKSIKLISFIISFIFINTAFSAEGIINKTDCNPQVVSDTCDVIYFKNGTTQNAKIIEITETEIKYKYCNNPNGPLITIFKHKVYKISYKNGESEFIETTKNKFEALSIISFIAGLGGLFYFGIILGVASIILGKIAIDKTKKNYKRGRKLAIASIIIGAIDIIGVIVFFL